MQLILFKKIMFTVINKIRIFIQLDKTNAGSIWASRGENTKLLDVQIDGYENRHDELKEILEEMKHDVLKHFQSKISRCAKILDYGCGTGRYIELLYGIENVNIVGIDLSESILNNYTKLKFPEGKFQCADFTKDNEIVEKYKETFDGIYSISVIQYVRYTELPRLMNAFYKVLKKQGILYLNFPHPNSRWDVLSNLGGIKYYPATIAKYLENAGFKVKESYSVYHKKFVKTVDDSGLPNYGYVIVAEKV